MLVEFFLGFIIACFAWYLVTKLPATYPPPPPIRLPILGHAHYLFWIKNTKKTSAFCEMFKRYSKNGVLTLHIGTVRMTLIGKYIFVESITLCIIASWLNTTGKYHIVKELFSREETNSRNHPRLANRRKRLRNNLTGLEGIAFSEGKTHQEQRRFMISTLKDFGFGKSNMESIINKEVSQFCDSADEVLISDINKEDVSLDNF